MPTFLVILVVIVGVIVFGWFWVKNWLKTMGARGLLYLVREGFKGQQEAVKAEYVSDETRAQVAGLQARVDALPEPGYFTNNQIYGSAPQILAEMFEIGEAIKSARAQCEKSQTPSTVESAPAELPPVAPLALPAPTEVVATDSPAPAQVVEVKVEPVTAPAEPVAAPAPKADVLAAFRAEYIKPNSGVLDAWLVGEGADTAIMYQLDPNAERHDVPFSFQNLPTIITWFPREQKA